VVALPAVAEKGYNDVHLSVISPGGFSGIPPKHTVGTIASHPRLIPNVLHRTSDFWLLSLPRLKPTPSSPSCPEVYPIPSLAQRNLNNPPCIDNVFYDTLICTAAHSAEVDQDLRKAILASTKSDKALKTVESVIFRDPLINALVGTTRAVDVVGGGFKS